MAIARTQRSELFRRVVLDRPPLLAPVGFKPEEPRTIESPREPRPVRPTLSYLERVLTTKSTLD